MFGIQNLCRINLRKGKKFKKGKFDIEYNKNKEDISEDVWNFIIFLRYFINCYLMDKQMKMKYLCLFSFVYCFVLVFQLV